MCFGTGKRYRKPVIHGSFSQHKNAVPPPHHFTFSHRSFTGFLLILDRVNVRDRDLFMNLQLFASFGPMVSFASLLEARLSERVRETVIAGGFRLVSRVSKSVCSEKRDGDSSRRWGGYVKRRCRGIHLARGI